MLKIAGAAYMLWLAWKVASAQPVDRKAEAPGRPMTFLQAAAFQWVNPKAVVAVLSGVAVYVRPGHERDGLIRRSCSRCSRLATALSTATWAGFGVALAAFPDAIPSQARIFNFGMARCCWSPAS